MICWRQGVPEQEVIRLGRQLTEALVEAQEQGVEIDLVLEMNYGV